MANTMSVADVERYLGPYARLADDDVKEQLTKIANDINRIYSPTTSEERMLAIFDGAAKVIVGGFSLERLQADAEIARDRYMHAIAEITGAKFVLE